MTGDVIALGGAPPAPRRSAVRQCWVLALRLVRPSLRNGEVLTALLSPAVFTLGFYVPLNKVMGFAGHGLSSYGQFLMPMIVLQGVSFCGTAAAFRAATDARDGLDTRFATMPMPSVTPLAARTTAAVYRIAIALVSALVCGYVVGFRFAGSGWETAGFLCFSLLLGLLLCLLGDLLGALSKSPEATTQALVLPQLILGMVSTGFAPAAQFPDWIRGFARDQPVSQFVDALRVLGGDPGGRAGVVGWDTVGPGLAWVGAGLLAFGGGSVAVALRRQR
ncbi:ABC-2 type transport system permease protein [Nocardia transvalensis]|uniref:ABC-2 type transport system permease protein n=1 Tax=Nocardia transvalensis TaxID=37333 RepID=A0A7W9P8P9_9NOCA|nr:ABC transporter permease [Nocardia transvalensis]MBB5911541.1 ABC-2 type transport system permease protein [Nocardia transvalensis]